MACCPRSLEKHNMVFQHTYKHRPLSCNTAFNDTVRTMISHNWYITMVTQNILFWVTMNCFSNTYSGRTPTQSRQAWLSHCLSGKYSRQENDRELMNKHWDKTRAVNHKTMIIFCVWLEMMLRLCLDQRFPQCLFYSTVQILMGFHVPDSVS